MRKLIVLFILGVSLVGCDKVKKNLKYLDGNWTLYEYQYTSATGLIYFYESSGTVSFSNIGENTCDYAMDITYLKQGTNYVIDDHGTINFIDEEYFEMNRVNQDGSITLLDYARIILITKDDLKMEYKDEYGIHEFILQK